MLIGFVPSSYADYAYTSEGADTFHYDGTSSVTNPTQITFDSYETTETIRICSQSNNLLNGNYIVAANKSGQTPVTGNFANFAYGVESPTTPAVVFRIWGTSNTALVTGVSITCSQISGYSQQTVTSTTGTEGGTPYIKYTMPLKDDKSWSVNSGPGRIVFTITFTFGGKEYVGHAYTTAKYVVRPNGLLRVGQWEPTWHNNKSFAHVTQLLCAQSVPGFRGTGGDHSYFDYNVTVQSGNALSGGGFDDIGKGSVIVQADANNNNDVGGLAWFKSSYAKDNWDTWKTINPADAEAKYRPHTINGDAPMTTIYIDKSYDHLGTGTASGKTNGLNMRMVWKTTDKGGNDPQRGTFMECIALSASSSLGSNLGASVATCGNATSGTMTVDLSHVYHNGSGFNNLSNMSTQGRKSDGTGGWVNADGDTLGANFVMHTFSGTGALTSDTIWRIDYLIKSTLNNSCSDSDYLKSTNGLFVKFITYDTATLRNILNAIDKGTGFTYNSTTYPGKGAFPQSWMYTGGWSAFESAYNTAKGVIADFQVDSGAVSSAISNLVSAYNGLTGYQPTGQFYVKHVQYGTTNELVPMQTFQYEGTWANHGSTPIRNGAAVELHALTDIQGYVSVGITSFTGSVSFTTDGAVLADTNNVTYGDTITFYYKPADKMLNIYTGMYGFDTSVQQTRQFIYSDTITAGTELNDLNSTPNFSSLKADIISQFGQPDHTNYAGMFTNQAYTGSPVDGINVSGGQAQWAMPFTETDLYVKWVPKPVRLKVVTSAGTEELVGAAATPTMTFDIDEGYQFSSVTFSQPSNPPTVSGYIFEGYYKDAAYTQPVSSWPIEADYDGNCDYAIADGTGANSGLGFVTIYAKYENVNNRIIFVPGVNATVENTTTHGGYTVTDNVLDFSSQIQGQSSINIDFPTPVREGYYFKGWTLQDGTAISGWTTGNAANGYNPVYIDADNLYGGVHPQVNSTGFIAYAQWEAMPVVITFQHNIPGTETNKMNSKNLAGTNYYYRLTVPAESAVGSTLPPAPRRYGYVFNFWKLDGMEFNANGNYPSHDATLIADWSNANSVVYGDLTSYVSLGSNDVITDIQHAPDTATTPVAMKGDTVKIKFNVGGKFFAGSSSWIFVYDNDFFEEVTGVDVVRLNTANGFVQAIGGAQVSVPDAALVENAYAGAMGTVTDPYSGATITNPGYIQVIIDPDLDNMGSFTTQSFDYPDKTLIEVYLKVKSNTTKTQGSFWLPEQLVRTADNLMGDTFVAYSATSRSLQEVQTDAVGFDRYPVTTVNILEQTRPTTTITAALPTENGVTLGAFSDGTTASKTFIGAADTEIATTYTTNGTTYYDDASGLTNPTQGSGFPEPTRTGYHLTGWATASDPTDTWGTIIGNPADYDDIVDGNIYNYASDAQDGKTYIAQWAPDEYELHFYLDNTMMTEVDGSPVQVTYDQTGADFYTPDPDGFLPDGSVLVGWIHDGDEATTENIVDFANYTVTGEDSFYAWIKLAPKEVVLTAQFYAPAGSDNQVDTELGHFTLDMALQTALGIELRVYDRLRVVETMPAEPVAGTQYVLASDLAAIFAATTGETVTLANGNTYTVPTAPYGTGSTATQYRQRYILDTDSIPVELTVSADNDDNNLIIPYTNATVTVTFYIRANAASGLTVDPANGWVASEDSSYCYEKVISGPYMSTFDFAAATAGVSRFGYKISSWSGAQPGVFSTAPGKTHIATFAAENVTFHFMNDDHLTDFATATQAFATNQRLNNTITKAGYIHNGWKIAKLNSTTNTYEAISDTVYAPNANYKCSDNDPVNTVVQTVGADATTYDIYFIPVFTAVPYDVVYWTVYTDGFQATTQYGSAVQVPYGDTYTPTTTPAPDVTGYRFYGWYNESNWNDIPLPPTSHTAQPFVMGAEQHNLYGFYVPHDYLVHFELDDGYYFTDVDDNDYLVSDITFNQPITAPADPTEPGYTFIGWSNHPANGAPLTASDKVTNFGNLTTVGDGQVVYYAIWQPRDDIHYYVDYYYEELDGTYVNDSSLTDTYTGTVGTTVSVQQTDVSDNVKTGFEYNADVSASTFTGVVPVTDNTLHLAVYYSRVKSTYKKTIDGVSTYLNADGTVCADQTNPAEIKYDAEITKPEDPAMEGYTFGGWNGWSSEGNTMTMPATDLELLAVFTVNQYAFTVDFNGGSLAQGATDPSGNYNYGAAFPQVPAVQKTGYSPAATAWKYYSVIDNVETEISAPATMPAYEVKAVAQWTINQYTITFNTNGGSAINSITQDYGTAVTAPADPTKEGYTFAGWQPAIPATMPAENLTVNAQWTVNQYTITFDTDGGTAINAITQNYGTAVTAPADPTKEGYTFAGWNRTIPVTMPAENITITAQWTINQYKITFNTNGGTAIDPITQDYNTDVTAPADPTKEGYTFNGWSPAVPSKMPAENITVVAQWTINQYTITFDTDGGSAIAPITQDYGTAITAPAAPTKEGYSFQGWSPAIPETMPAQDTTVVAQWQINQYTISFNSAGGTSVPAITLDYNTEIGSNYAGDPTREGYTFAGWSPELPARMPAENKELTAQWTIGQYSIAFNSNGGSAVTPITADYGAAISAPAAPTKTGYTFAGWYTDDGTFANPYNIPATMPAYDAPNYTDNTITVYAKWTENNYNVQFIQPDDNYTGAPTYTDATPYADFATPVPVNYTATLGSVPAEGPYAQYFEFKGWSTDPNVAIDGAIINVTTWTPSEWVAAGNSDANQGTINFYPVYTRVEVTLIIETNSDADIVVPENPVPPVTGYIYNAGTKLTEAKLRAQLEVTGNGHLEVYASKNGKICGTGTRVELVDDYDNSVKEVYFLIIAGDVNGDSLCTANDVSIANQARLNGDSQWYLPAVANETAEQQAARRECCRLAADVSDQYGVFDDYDTAQIEYYVLSGGAYSYNSETKHYSAASV